MFLLVVGRNHWQKYNFIFAGNIPSYNLSSTLVSYCKQTEQSGTSRRSSELFIIETEPEEKPTDRRFWERSVDTNLSQSCAVTEMLRVLQCESDWAAMLLLRRRAPEKPSVFRSSITSWTRGGGACRSDRRAFSREITAPGVGHDGGARQQTLCLQVRFGVRSYCGGNFICIALWPFLTRTPHSENLTYINHLPEVLQRQGEQSEQVSKERRPWWMVNFSQNLIEKHVDNTHICLVHFAAGLLYLYRLIWV